MIETPAFTFDPSGHVYRLGDIEIPSVTRILDTVGLISSYSKDPVAAERGTDIHLAAKYLFQGILDWSTVSMEIMPYVVSIDRWLEATGYVANSCEGSDWHKTLLYAGSWDTEGLIPKHGNTIIDLKSGVPARWHRWQLAGYKGLVGRGKKAGSLYAQKDGSMAKFVSHNDPVYWQQFISALNVYRMLEES